MIEKIAFLDCNIIDIIILVENFTFLYLLFSPLNPKRVFGDILDRKINILNYKIVNIRKFKALHFFPKGLVHDFGEKLGVASLCLFAFNLVKRSLLPHS